MYRYEDLSFESGTTAGLTSTNRKSSHMSTKEDNVVVDNGTCNEQDVVERGGVMLPTILGMPLNDW